MKCKGYFLRNPINRNRMLAVKWSWLPLKVQAGKKQAANSDVSIKPERVPNTLSWCYLWKEIWTFSVPLQKYPILIINNNNNNKNIWYKCFTHSQSRAFHFVTAVKRSTKADGQIYLHVPHLALVSTADESKPVQPVSIHECFCSARECRKRVAACSGCTWTDKM